MTGIEMTREDLDNIAATKAGVETLKGSVTEVRNEIQVLNVLIKGQYTKCMDHFAAQDEEIEKLKTCACEEKIAKTAIQTWKDAIFNKSTAIVVIIIGGLDIVMRFFPWGH